MTPTPHRAAALAAALMVAAPALAQDCGCQSYPFQPASCFDTCAARVLSTGSFNQIFETLSLSEDVQSDILAAQTTDDPPASLADYSEPVQSEVRAGFQSADPDQIEALLKAE